MGRVLHVAAHPDDENTQLIAYLAHERGYQAAYLSMTRGEGGQNLIGEELGAGLGAIRASELLAARGIDGGLQYFTRAPDFGYSKDYRETLEKWNHGTSLSDVVRVIRTFRPHVIVTRFPPEPSDGMHGHHTASTILAMEAFDLAGDPSAFPEQLDALQPWQPTRIVWNQFGESPPERSFIETDIGGYSSLRGQSYGEISALSRSMHKSQGFGAVGTRGRQMARFVHLAGEPASVDLFDGIDTSWTLFEGGEAVLELIDSIIEEYEVARPSASVRMLLELRRRMNGMPALPELNIKRKALDRVLLAALGLNVETRIPESDVVPGDSLRMTHTAIARSNVPVRWRGVQYPDEVVDLEIDLDENVPAVRRSSRILPSETPLSHPHWMRNRVDEASSREDVEPSIPAPYSIQHLFEVDGELLRVQVTPEHVIRDPVRGEVRRALRVVPPVVVSFSDDVVLIRPGGTAEVRLHVRAGRDEVEGLVQLDLPDGWTAAPKQHALHLRTEGDEDVLAFVLRAPDRSERVEIGAEVVIGDERHRVSMEEIVYDHIPRILQFPEARLIAMSADVATSGRSIGYVMGAGDAVGEGLRRMGYVVSSIDPSAMTAASLTDHDAIVLGIRALNARSDLASRMDLLFDYVHRGGTLVMQYNVSRGLLADPAAPHPLTIGRGRITDETAPLAALAPDHPSLTFPNHITDADFEGWVQERGLYFADDWGPAFEPVLSGSDPNEDELEGALLIASHGDGYFVYTGLSFFRQIPAGVPGAYRLLANLVSFGQ